jgi:manganese/zinc/iron transport system permease protein
MQAGLPVWHKQVQMLLFGQAATMSDMHIWIYGALAFTIVLFLTLTFRKIQAFLFDRNFSISAKMSVKSFERIFFWLLLFSLIVGIRSVGVILMSGMAIAPAVAARQFTNRLKTMFVLAALFGSLSGLLGNYFSVCAFLPTGPSIVLVGTAIALFSLLFAPKRGLLFRLVRIWAFRLKCVEENILKAIWRTGKFSENRSIFVRFALWRLKRGGWLDGQFQLTSDGQSKAASVVRLHRLWELYLAKSLGFQGDKIHHTAEEMEHIITSEMEEKLIHLLENPKRDPHKQPIPQRGL